MGVSVGDDARFAPERQQLLVEALRATGRLRSAEMASRLRVSTETVRKDLLALERRGLLRKVHGGAMPVESLAVEAGVSERSDQRAAKARIARAALALVPPGGAVLLDAGTTVAALAALLPGDRPLTVMTNALPTALALVDKPALQVLTLGGRVRAVTRAEVGNWAIRSLSELHVDVAFLGTNAFDVETGFTTPDEAEAAVKAAMVAAARQRVVLADHTKAGRTSVFRFATVADIDVLLTDTGLADDDDERLSRTGLSVIRA